MPENDTAIKFAFDTGGRQTFALAVEEISDGYTVEKREIRVLSPIEQSTLVSSALVANPKIHKPCLDIDFEAMLIPSSTEGHYHLYLDKPMTWWRYKRLLRALWKAGIIEEGHYKMSLSRKGTHLRLPWVKK